MHKQHNQTETKIKQRDRCLFEPCFLSWLHETCETHSAKLRNGGQKHPSANRTHRVQVSTRGCLGVPFFLFALPGLQWVSLGPFFCEHCLPKGAYLLELFRAPTFGPLLVCGVCSDSRRDTAWEWDKKGFCRGRWHTAKVRRILKGNKLERNQPSQKEESTSRLIGLFWKFCLIC